MKTLLTLLFVLLLLGGALYGVAVSGVVDVSAMESSPPAVDWFLERTRESSIRERSEDIPVPDLSDEAMVARGVAHYQQTCAVCHGAPGVEASQVGRGMNPAPPDLSAPRALGGDPSRDFWIVKNGIRMTGMPAFGPTHSEEDLWALVALVQRMPELTPEDYASFAREAGVPLEAASPESGAARAVEAARDERSDR